MPKREQIQKPAPQERQAEPEVQPKASPSAEELKAESDALLDEIDALLEENAEEFVRGYVQKGGE